MLPGMHSCRMKPHLCFDIGRAAPTTGGRRRVIVCLVVDTSGTTCRPSGGARSVPPMGGSQPSPLFLPRGCLPAVGLGPQGVPRLQLRAEHRHARPRCLQHLRDVPPCVNHRSGCGRAPRPRHGFRSAFRCVVPGPSLSTVAIRSGWAPHVRDFFAALTDTYGSYPDLQKALHQPPTWWIGRPPLWATPRGFYSLRPGRWDDCGRLQGKTSWRSANGKTRWASWPLASGERRRRFAPRRGGVTPGGPLGAARPSGRPSRGRRAAAAPSL